MGVNHSEQPYRELVEHLVGLHQLLDDLAYQLELHTLLITSGSVAALQRSTSELDALSKAVADAERRCARLTARTGSAALTPLSELARLAPTPWDGLLRHHHHALSSAQTRVSDLAADAGRAARRAARHHRDLYDMATGAAQPEYSASPAPLERRTLVLDRSV